MDPDRLLGAALIVVATVLFAYYTVWTLVLPFVEADQPLHRFFPDRYYAVAVPAYAGVVRAPSEPHACARGARGARNSGDTTQAAEHRQYPRRSCACAGGTQRRRRLPQGEVQQEVVGAVSACARPPSTMDQRAGSGGQLRAGAAAFVPGTSSGAASGSGSASDGCASPGQPR